jgi:hypothetical protein
MPYQSEQLRGAPVLSRPCHMAAAAHFRSHSHVWEQSRCEWQRGGGHASNTTLLFGWIVFGVCLPVCHLIDRPQPKP